MAHAVEKDQPADESKPDRRNASRRQSDREAQQRAVAAAWLSWQCKMVAGVLCGAVFSVENKQLQSVQAHWPQGDKQLPALTIFAKQALDAGDVLISPLPKTTHHESQAQDHIAIPISNSGGQYIVVMHIIARSQSQQQAVVQLIQWGGIWLGSLDQVVGDFAGTGTSVSIQLAEQVLSHQDMYAACLQAVNQLADELNCDRVSIGLLKNKNIRLQAISQISDFDKRVALVRTMEMCMEEAIDQRTIVNTSSTNSMVMTRAHDELASTHGGYAACTVPLYCNSETIGAVLLERDSDVGFNGDTVQQIANLLAPLGPVLQLIHREQRSYITRVADKARRVFSKESIPTTMQGRAAVGIGVLAALFALFVPVPYNVSAQASIEGSDKQVLVAPQAGYIKSASARAGDRVVAGQVIASLEDRELTLEREKWLGELGKLETAFAGALTARDRSELGILQAKKTQVEAELALIDEKLRRANLTAPFDGVLVSGDLNQSLGSPVDVGEVLFEIASMESYRLVLEVDEHDVAGVEAGQSGVLRFSALPGNKHEFTTSSVVPVALTRDRRSVFSVEAELNEAATNLRPGMQGVAKIRVGDKPLIWIWTHGIVSKLRLWFWKSGLL